MMGLAAASSAWANGSGEVSLVRVYNGWRDAASFKRISEYFTGRENIDGQVVLRTHPDERAGYYFLVRVKNPAAPQAVTATLDIVRAGNAGTQTYTFPASLGTGDTVFNLGLTGRDWTDPKAAPVAWRLTFKGADGQTLASERSYLWEKPGAP